MNIRPKKLQALGVVLPTLLLSLWHAPVANGCPTYSDLTRKGYAAADIVFEGSVSTFHPALAKSHPVAKRPETAVGAEITFIIETVIKGTLDQRTIRVAWRHGTFGHPNSLTEFHKQYGENLRIGIITPDSMIDDCNRRTTRKNKDTGLDQMVTLKIRCKKGYTGRIYDGAQFVDGAQIDDGIQFGKITHPVFILNGHCTGPYMIPVDSVKDSQSRDISKFTIGDERFNWAADGEVSDFVWAFALEHPEIVATYRDEQSSRDFVKREFIAFGNIDQTDTTEKEKQDFQGLISSLDRQMNRAAERKIQEMKLEQEKK